MSSPPAQPWGRWKLYLAAACTGGAAALAFRLYNSLNSADPDMPARAPLTYVAPALLLLAVSAAGAFALPVEQHRARTGKRVLLAANIAVLATLLILLF